MLVYVYVYHTLEEPGVDEVLVTLVTNAVTNVVTRVIRYIRY